MSEAAKMTIEDDWKLEYYRNHAIGTSSDRYERAVIVIHGTKRNADVYYNHAKRAIDAHTEAENILLIAPRFQKSDDGPDDDSLYWTNNGWKIGFKAVNGSRTSSFEVIDVILNKISNNFSKVKHVTIIGHSAGGQFIQRYAALNTLDEENTLGFKIHYVVANPSSYMYLTDERFVEGKGFVKEERFTNDCADYDNYKYGLSDLPGVLSYTDLSKANINDQLLKRSVHLLLGTTDTEVGGYLDESCEANLQGPNRFERGKNYSKYIRKVERLANHYTYLVDKVGHSPSGMLNSDEGKSLMVDIEAVLNQGPNLRFDDKVIAKGLGASVAISGDTAVVGAPYTMVGMHRETGKVIVYKRINGVWNNNLSKDNPNHPKELVVEGLGPWRFGTSVAISGDEKTIVVGLPWKARKDDNDKLQAQVGGAFVFKLDGSGNWAKQAELDPPTVERKHIFGQSVAINQDGTKIVVGAPGDPHFTAGNYQGGRAYVFTNAGGQWSEGKSLKPENSEKKDMFGHAVAISKNGQTIVIGAPEKSRAYVFSANGANWTEKPLQGFGLHQSDGYGQSVAISGDTIVVGANKAERDHRVMRDHGKVFVFRKGSNSDWAAEGLADQAGNEKYLMAHDAMQNDAFGWSVAIDGDLIVVGARFALHEKDQRAAGSAYIFRHETGKWKEVRELNAGQETNGQMGFAVGISGNKVVVGLPGEETEGAAYVFNHDWSKALRPSPSST